MKLLFQQIGNHKCKTATAVFLLVAEVLFCLYFPFLIGNLFYYGVQRHGFLDTCPEVISEKAMSAFLTVLPKDIGNELQSFYFKSNTKPDHIPEQYSSERTIYYIKENSDKEHISEIFENSVLAILCAVRNTEEFEKYNYDELLDELSIRKLYILSGHLHISENTKESYYLKAQQSATSIKKQVLSIIVPYIYEDAKIDCKTVFNNYIFKIGICMFLCVLGQFFCSILSAVIVASLASDIQTELKCRILKHTSGFGKKQLGKFSLSHIAYEASNGTEKVALGIRYGFRLLINSTAFSIGGLILSFLLNPVFGVIILLSGILITISIVIVYRTTSVRYYRMQEQYETFSARVSTNIKQFLSLKISRAEKAEIRVISSFSDNIKYDENYVTKAVLISTSLFMLVTNIMMAIITVISASEMLNSTISIGNVISGILYSVMTITSFAEIGAMTVFAPKAIKAFDDIDEILNCDVNLGNNQNLLCKSGINEICFENVCVGKGTPKISFTAKKGTVTVIAGDSATGKTSLLEYMTGYSTPYSGKILYNGIDLLSYNKEDLLSHISFSASRPTIFSGTVEWNMLLHGSSGSFDKMSMALSKAYCDFIPSLQTKIENNGEKLSGGQKSRLSLACAFASDAEVFIFDDCLTSLDSETEKKILQNIFELKSYGTVFIVTKNKWCLKKADNIIFLSSAGIDAEGSFDDLLNRSLNFRRFVE